MAQNLLKETCVRVVIAAITKCEHKPHIHCILSKYIQFYNVRIKEAFVAGHKVTVIYTSRPREAARPAGLAYAHAASARVCS